MATLSESEVIKSNPIGDGLNAFRDAFQSSLDRVQQIIDRGEVQWLATMCLLT
jgi:hypothetical protein